MLERNFQSQLIKELKETFPGSVVQKIDSYIQGFPDVLILYKDKWAALECKKSKKEHKQPNQEFYVDLLNEMSFSRFVYPENKETVIHELQRSFES